MSHDIESAVFMASQGAGWTGLGRAIPPEIAKDPAKIAELCNATYTVQAVPLYYDVRVGDKVIKVRTKEYVGQVRSDTHALLSVTSLARYHTTNRQPVDIFEAFRDDLTSQGWDISHAAVLRGGSVVAVSAILPPEYDLVIGQCDRLRKYVTLSTGYNPRAGGASTKCTNGSIRVVCANTLAASLADAAKHDRLRVLTAAMELGYDSLKNLVADVKSLRDAEYAAFNDMANRQMSDVDVARFFADVLEINIADLNRKNDNGKDLVSTKAKNMLAALAQAYKEAPGAAIASGSAWGALHAVTYFATHQKTVRDTRKDGDDVARATSNMLGDAAALKARALQLAMVRVAA